MSTDGGIYQRLGALVAKVLIDGRINEQDLSHIFGFVVLELKMALSDDEEDSVTKDSRDVSPGAALPHHPSEPQ
jgi:hypothetical protein